MGAIGSFWVLYNVSCSSGVRCGDGYWLGVYMS
jgi:hypothetical protein